MDPYWVDLNLNAVEAAPGFPPAPPHTNEGEDTCNLRYELRCQMRVSHTPPVGHASQNMRCFPKLAAGRSSPQKISWGGLRLANALLPRRVAALLPRIWTALGKGAVRPALYMQLAFVPCLARPLPDKIPR